MGPGSLMEGSTGLASLPGECTECMELRSASRDCGWSSPTEECGGECGLSGSLGLGGVDVASAGAGPLAYKPNCE